MAYKVIQWATGNVGRHAVRGLVDHPETELVGAFVYTPAKVGKDVGDICGIGSIGVAASGSVDEVLGLRADCVVYAPLLPNVEEVSRILESGKNVVTPVGWFYPPSLPSDVVETLEAACRRGGASLHGTGINPGGASDVFPILASSLCARVRGVTVEEFSDIRNYNSPDVIRHVMLMGSPPEALGASPMLQLLGASFRQSIDMVAFALGIRLEAYDATHELAIATAPIEGRFGTIAPGTVGGQRFTWRGLVGGDPVVTTRVHWLMGFESLEPLWTFETEGDAISLDADPPVRLRLTTAWPDAGRGTKEQAFRRDHGIVATAMHAVNAIPSVVEARPGIRTYLDLPIYAGRLQRPAGPPTSSA